MAYFRPLWYQLRIDLVSIGLQLAPEHGNAIERRGDYDKLIYGQKCPAPGSSGA